TRASTPASAPSVAPAAAPPAPTPDLSAHRANPAGSMPPSTGPAVPTPIDAILRQVRSKVSAGVRELEIRLDPKELGRIDLRFLMRGESLHVTVRATSTEVVNALRHD